jgi:hypothetical protein
MGKWEVRKGHDILVELFNDAFMSTDDVELWMCNHNPFYTKEENEIIKSGNGDELWQDKPNKKSHKDIDARWTKKNDETFYG